MQEVRRSGGRLRLLDGLRFVAAFSVVLFHYTARTNPAWGANVVSTFPVLSQFTSFGYLGVWLFFLISGFVIMMSVDGKGLREFVLARVTRLYPAFWCGVILTGALLLATRFNSPGGSWQSVRLGGFLLNFTMLQQTWGVPGVDGVYWSLWVELIFYGLIGLLFVLHGVNRRGMLVLAIAWPVGAQLAMTLGFPALSQFLGPMFAPFFGLGIVLYLIRRDGFRISYVLVFGADLSIGMFEASEIIPGWIRGGTPTAPGGTATAIVMLLLVTLVAVVTLTPLQRVDWRFLSVLGALTYPLYLIHEIWGWWIISQLRHVLPVPLTLAVTIALVLALAAAIHWGVERPVAKLLRRWIARDAKLVEGERALLPKWPTSSRLVRTPRSTALPSGGITSE